MYLDLKISHLSIESTQTPTNILYYILMNNIVKSVEIRNWGKSDSWMSLSQVRKFCQWNATPILIVFNYLTIQYMVSPAANIINSE